MSGPRDQEELPGYDFNAGRIGVLRDRIEVLEADVAACATLLEEGTATMDMARARIEALEAALRRISITIHRDYDETSALALIKNIADAALAPEQDK